MKITGLSTYIAICQTIFGFVAAYRDGLAFTSCTCDDSTLVQTVSANFILTSGKEASVEDNWSCSDASNPDYCDVWETTNKSFSTGICGVGDMGYGYHVFSKDKVQYNGIWYTADDMNKSEFTPTDDFCQAACENYGDTYNERRGAVGYFTDGFPEAKEC